MRRTVIAAAAAAVVLAVVPVRGAPSVEHGTTASFDGTKIAWSFFSPSAGPAPVVFYTHGWAGSRARTASGTVGELLRRGYAVLTWDARGFGDSGGEANVDSQEFEVRDVQALIDMVAPRSEVRLDAEGDPRMGMLGGSYAGAIQLMVAAADARVDAIVPQIAWNDLLRSLYPNRVVKFGWGTALFGAGVVSGTMDGLDSPAGPEARSLAPEILRAYAEGTSLNMFTEDTVRWFDARSVKHYIDGGVVAALDRRVRGVRAPALIIQGTTDTLFTLTEGIHNFRQLRAQGVDAKMIFFCGGHTLNLAGTSCRIDPAEGPTQAAVVDRAIYAWFDRYLRGRDVHTGATVTYQLQDGTFATADRLPTRTVSARGGGFLANTVAPTNGAVLAATSAPDGLRFATPVRAGTTVLGIPRARVDVQGSVLIADATVFLKLIDQAPDGKLTVVDDQATPVRAGLLNAGPLDVEMNGVAWRLEEGHRLLVELSSTANDHSSARTPAVLEVEVTVSLPVLGGVANAKGGGASVLGERVTRGGILPATGTPWPLASGLVLIAIAAVLAHAGRRARA